MTAETIVQISLATLGAAAQVREHFDDVLLKGLAISMREVGLMQPIRARRNGDRLVIVDGERRTRAATLLGWTTIAAIIEECELSSAEIVQRQLIANCQRADLKPTEKAAAIHKLMESAGCTAGDAGVRLGMSGGSVTRALALLKLPESIRQRIDSGAIPGSAGYDLARIEDPAEQAMQADRLASGETTRDALRGTVKARKGNAGDNNALASSATPPLKRIALPLGGGRSLTVHADAASIEAVIAIVEDVLAKLRKARTKGWSLRSFLNVARDSQT